MRYLLNGRLPVMGYENRIMNRRPFTQITIRAEHVC